MSFCQPSPPVWKALNLEPETLKSESLECFCRRSEKAVEGTDTFRLVLATGGARHPCRSQGLGFRVYLGFRV